MPPAQSMKEVQRAEQGPSLQPGSGNPCGPSSSGSCWPRHLKIGVRSWGRTRALWAPLAGEHRCHFPPRRERRPLRTPCHLSGRSTVDLGPKDQTLSLPPPRQTGKPGSGLLPHPKPVPLARKPSPVGSPSLPHWSLEGRACGHRCPKGPARQRRALRGAESPTQ